VAAKQRARAKAAAVYLEPMASIGYLARINFRAFARALERRTLPEGVSGGQWRFLRVLWEHDGGLTQRELSDLVGTTEATTVRSVRRLMKSGLVTRSADPADSRKRLVTLTPRARRLRDTLMPFVVDVNRIAAAGISDEDVATTRRVLAQMYANLQRDLNG
jgi:DNA-binding MarR family transcriptional regulator